jgi:hypothetical protein
MENRGLLFIPDISGFTQFVNRVEIEHTKLIVQELLEILVNANQIGLEISEIEGDAILFYKFGDSPDMKALYQQVERMFQEFHRSLNAYEYSRYCQCSACMSAIDLTLKVVTHYGEFTNYQVQNFKKLIGKDVIVAHQLLKNDIEQHEYWLVTNSLVNDTLPAVANEIEWNTSVKQTENGDISFRYAQLGPLKNNIPPFTDPQLEIPDKVKMVSYSKEFDTDIITLFRTTGMFDYRSQWQNDIIKVEELNHFLPRVGMKCRAIYKDKEVVFYSSSYTFSPDRIQFSETDEDKKTSTYYILEKINDQRTRLTIEYYMKKNFLSNTLFNLKEKKKMEATLQKSFQNLDPLLKVIEFPY